MAQPVTIQYVSDLHLEFSPCCLPILPETDILVLAGDIHSDVHKGAKFVKTLLEQAGPRPSGHFLHIVIIPGNHECYKRTYTDTIALMRLLYEPLPSVHFLELDAVIIFGIKFVGATLWCDPPTEAHFLIQRSITDFSRIKDWTPGECQKQCRLACQYIEAQAHNQGMPVVVVTHFCPSFRSIHEKYKARPSDRAINCYFATPLDDLIQRCAPAAWIHGHTHSSMNYVIGGSCRVLCNPRGYSDVPNQHSENDAFDPTCCLTLSGKHGEVTL